MYINELKENDFIEVEIQDGTREIIVPSKVLRCIKNSIVIENITLDGKVVVFDKDNIRINIVYQKKNENPIAWNNVIAQNINTETIKGILVYSKNQGIKKNRRNTFRVPLGINGKIQGETVVIHDISVSGISFRTKMDAPEKEIGSKVKISFEANYEPYTVNATIVRKAEENGRILYGCKIEANINIDKLISIEQRKQMRRR